MPQRDKSVGNKGNALPLQKLLEGDYLRVMEMHEDFNSLSEVPHRHDHYELLLITKGQGSHFIDFKEYEVKPGRLYFLHPGQVHLIDRFKRHGWLIMFGEELFKKFLELHRHEDEVGILDFYTPYPFIDLQGRLANLFQQVIEQLSIELSAEKVHAGILFHYAALLLLEANRAHQRQHPKSLADQSHRAEFHQLRQLIEAHYKQEHLASFYAERLQADIKKLNRICRESTGFTVAELLKERLLTESKVQLHISSSSVKAISYSLGFNDPAFFGRFFKKHTGLTPAEFRDLRLI
ncbi:AraC-like DNA-binding protein [Mucilaginibacter yixingensis]|uniref:AraC-like DNA-binding protein n=1 Tax=Mucilaginibacter yixingensis TaxID=1295612 RepID=A0A2T5JH07_9SPHI|nr:helix-turn-helix domain-containing protein [Mucilaginibacter yixingensis]PTR01691.1 AraC-like DNA-binding protein [Mucilaginibacter yixingensis]